jgi:hypothetical protein
LCCPTRDAGIEKTGLDGRFFCVWKLVKDNFQGKAFSSKKNPSDSENHPEKDRYQRRPPYGLARSISRNAWLSDLLSFCRVNVTAKHCNTTIVPPNTRGLDWVDHLAGRHNG